MHMGMVSQGKDWIRKKYGTTCVFTEERVDESSTMLNKKRIPQKTKDAEECLKCVSCNRKNDAKKNSWKIKNYVHVPKEIVKHDTKIDEWVDVDESNNDIVESQDK